jgi:DNA-binding beta-propeller fold protein YncE
MELTFAVADWREALPADLSHREVADVCVDAHERLFLYGRYDHAVYAYDRNGAFLRSWGNELFGRSHGITAGPDGAIYCVDDGAHAVRKFSPDGALQLTLGTPNEPADTGYDGRNSDTIRCSAGPFNRCTSLAVAPNGDLYVTDGYGNARVHHFSARGELRRSWGAPGTEPGQFRIPHGVCVLGDGRVLVADRENNRIQFFDPDGTFLEEWTDLERPASIALDASGRIYVAEMKSRVSVFEPDGRLVARWGAYGCEAGNFIAPHGIAVDPHGDVYVAEVVWTLAGRHGKVPEDCHQIQRFSPVQAPQSAGAKRP